MKPRTLLAILILALSLGGGAFAENAGKRFRLGLALGAHNPQGEVPSDSANVLTIVDDALLPISVFTDPRRDDLFFANLEVQTGALGQLTGAYAFTRLFVLEASVGYSVSDIGDVEVQARFDQDISSDGFGMNYRAFRVPVGQLTTTPLQLSAIARFRPQKRFNPYVGGGAGYQFMSFDSDPAFDELSANMAASTGIQAELVPAVPGLPPIIIVPMGVPEEALRGASVDVRDGVTWHLLAGAEYSWSPRWAVTFDLRHVWSETPVTIGFNGSEDLGISTPQMTVPEGSPLTQGPYGPMRVRTGGLIDGGSIVPGLGRPADTDCDDTPIFCVFDPTQPDGVPDTGFYYVNGGDIDLRAFSFTIGVRYTFR